MSGFTLSSETALRFHGLHHVGLDHVSGIVTIDNALVNEHPKESPPCS